MLTSSASGQLIVDKSRSRNVPRYFLREQLRSQIQSRISITCAPVLHQTSLAVQNLRCGCISCVSDPQMVGQIYFAMVQERRCRAAAPRARLRTDCNPEHPSGRARLKTSSRRSSLWFFLPRAPTSTGLHQKIARIITKQGDHLSISRPTRNSNLCNAYLKTYTKPHVL